MRESKIQRHLIVGIAALGGCAEKFTSPGKRFVPDLLVTWPVSVIAHNYSHISYMQPAHGEPIHRASTHAEFIETKSYFVGGRLSPGQLRDHARRREMGYAVWVIWTMEQAEHYLRMRGKKP